jgi:hypothetical protein
MEMPMQLEKKLDELVEEANKKSKCLDKHFKNLGINAFRHALTEIGRL